ncbi:MAG: YgaP family membrane protein [Mucilaginibacter sp.]
MKERIVRAVAGTFVLTSIALVYYVNINWIWLGVFVGANLLQSSFTKFCPLEIILDATGIKDANHTKC